MNWNWLTNVTVSAYPQLTLCTSPRTRTQTVHPSIVQTRSDYMLPRVRVCCYVKLAHKQNKFSVWYCYFVSSLSLSPPPTPFRSFFMSLHFGSIFFSAVIVLLHNSSLFIFACPISNLWHCQYINRHTHITNFRFDIACFGDTKAKPNTLNRINYIKKYKIFR